MWRNNSMKKKIKVGIPRAFLYYRYYILWKNFFEIIGCNIVLSPNTDSDIVKVGNSLSVDESCLPSKIYLGHISYLSDKCDYVLVPRIYSYGRKKRVCVKFNGIYDVVNNLFSNIKILDYNIDNLKFRYELFGFVKMGLRLNKNIFRIIYAYIVGSIRQYKYNSQELTLLKETSFKGLQSSVREATILENGNIIASVIYGNEKPLLLLSSQLDSLNNFGELPDNEHKSTDLRTYSSILSSYKNIFIQTMCDLGYLACYEQKEDNTILKKWEYYLEKPLYKGSELNRTLLKRGFIDVKMTPNYIFCVYSGQKWDLTGISDQPKNILVFNHKGKLLNNFHLDRAIGKIAVSEDEKIIFAVSIEPDIDIVRYDIADRL